MSPADMWHRTRGQSQVQQRKGDGDMLAFSKVRPRQPDWVRGRRLEAGVERHSTRTPPTHVAATYQRARWGSARVLGAQGTDINLFITVDYEAHSRVGVGQISVGSRVRYASCSFYVYNSSHLWQVRLDMATSKRTKSQNGQLSPNGLLVKSCRTMPMVGGFSRGSPVFSALAFRPCFIPRFTLIGSQDLHIKSRPNHSTPNDRGTRCCLSKSRQPCIIIAVTNLAGWRLVRTARFEVASSMSLLSLLEYRLEPLLPLYATANSEPRPLEEDNFLWRNDNLQTPTIYIEKPYLRVDEGKSEVSIEQRQNARAGNREIQEKTR
ncbi:hypothetical protein PR048_016301 [Dryococelus australis]|uniref:Uncharacterized protein n=1 Tax=Dryococelus australis TaxID=614101 RepID=A0ABQ9HJD8_9NEOP|nr:hypothetical protein PR048_016301 [Dryococelus australis]